MGYGSVLGVGYALEAMAATESLSLMGHPDWRAEIGTANQHASECMIEREAL